MFLQIMEYFSVFEEHACSIKVDPCHKDARPVLIVCQLFNVREHLDHLSRLPHLKCCHNWLGV